MFVSGHTGFKGAWLTAWLQEVGAQVTGFALPAEAGSLFAAAGLDAGMTSIEGDVRDGAALDRALRAAMPDIVFHMAAQSLVRRSYEDPVGTYATNVMGTVHVLDSLRRVSSACAIVIVTSDKCYSYESGPKAFRETDPLGGHDPYSSSKAAAEVATAGLRLSFFGRGNAAVASVRAGNVVGGGDWAEDRLVPDLMRAAAARVPALVRRPNATRPWQYVLEPLRGYLEIGRRLAEEGRDFSGSWNFGPVQEDEVRVRDVVREIAAHWDRVTARYAPETSGPPEAASLSLDSGKARDRLGWRPALTLGEALDLTTSWYRDAFEQPAAAKTLIQDHLHRYEQCAERAEEVR